VLLPTSQAAAQMPGFDELELLEGGSVQWGATRV
jgi:hypothetical protein